MTGDDLAATMPDVARTLLGDPVAHLSTATHWRYGRRGSLAVNVQRGLWCDHEAATGGGVLDLIRRQNGGDVRAALRWLRDGFQGRIAHAREIVPPTVQQAHQSDPSRTAAALRLWREARQPLGTPVAGYLASRGLSLGLLDPSPGTRIRFAPACPFGPGTRLPAMLALLTDIATGKPVGIRRTAITTDGARARALDGGKLPHKALGRAGNAVARLGGASPPPTDLALCEGVETGLSVIAVTGATVWACPAGTLRRFPVLPGVERLAIYADNDPPGLDAARATAARWAAAGRTASIIAPDKPGADFNDIWLEMQHG